MQVSWLLVSAILSSQYVHTCTLRYTTTYYVTPNASTTPCPQDPCYEFKTYYQNSSYYFQSNTRFIFLPGVHVFGLGDLLLVQDKYNISLVGSANLTVHTVAEKVKEYGFDQHDEDDHITYLESSIKIVCSNQSGFAFANISYLVLANLSIVNCGQYNQVTSFTAAVHLVSVLHLSMDGVSVQNSTGNQAFLGANFNLVIVVGSYLISLDDIHNMQGVAMAGGAGVHVDITVFYPGVFRSFTVSDSMFECNYVHQSAWRLGSSMDIVYTISNILSLYLQVIHFYSSSQSSQVTGVNSKVALSGVVVFSNYSDTTNALVGVLFALNLTVPAGTLNGMILYANVFRINDNIFFPASQRSPLVQFLSIAIAWFNLDFGIEICFYDGMDSYTKTWLQFAFPFYIFTLVGMIIVVGRYSSLVSKLCRFNVVPVLATLILLSYSKILRTIITIFSHAALETEDSTDVVWLYDGNVQFLELKHAVLFVFGLTVLTFFIVPYTTLLLIAPCLQAKSHWRCFHWINRIKPFLDCYQAPFKDKYRFWSGVLLLGRLLLYLLFALENDPTYKLWGIMGCTYVYVTIMTALSVYKNWFHLLLEILFIMNLSALVATSLLHWSLGFAIAGAIVFLLSVCGVVILHAFHQCKRILWLRSRMNPSINTTQPLANGASNVSDKDVPNGITISNRNNDDEVREPLLFDDS
eukprot:Em0126g10a